MKLYMIERAHNSIVKADIWYKIYNVEDGKTYKWAPSEVKKLMVENGLQVENLELVDGTVVIKNLNPIEDEKHYNISGTAVCRRYKYIVVLDVAFENILYIACDYKGNAMYGYGTAEDIASVVGCSIENIKFYNATKRKTGEGKYEVIKFSSDTYEYNGENCEEMNRLAYIMRSLEEGNYADVDVAINGAIELNNLHREDSGEFIVPDGVEYIGYGDGGVSRLVTPKSLKAIKKEAFREMDDIDEVVLSSGIEEIGDAAFYESSLKKVNTPRTIKRVGKAAFASSKLKGNMKIRASEICENAFASTDLKSIECVGTKVIKRGAFRENYKLKELDFGEEVTEIPYGAAYGCFNLKHVIIHSACKIIGKRAFEGCEKLRKVYVPVGTIICDGAFDKHTKIIKY